MIHHWNGLDLEITDCNYHYDPTHSGEIIPFHKLFCFNGTSRMKRLPLLLSGLRYVTSRAPVVMLPSLTDFWGQSERWSGDRKVWISCALEN